MKIAAVAELGGLGSKEGPGTIFNAILPSALPNFLPWLLVLLLFLPKANRCAQAWWVLVPLGLVAGTCEAVEALGDFASNSAPHAFLEVMTTLTFGLTVTWLLAPYLRRSHRALTLLLTLVAMAGGSFVVFLLRQGWVEEWTRGPGGIAIATLVGTACLSLALSLAGLACRRRYGRMRLFVWLLGIVAVLWLLIITPFFVKALVQHHGAPTLLEFCMVLLVAIGVSFGPLLAFLVLAFSNRFYGARLQRLLHAEPATPPVMAALPRTGATV